VLLEPLIEVEGFLQSSSWVSVPHVSLLIYSDELIQLRNVSLYLFFLTDLELLQVLLVLEQRILFTVYEGFLMLVGHWVERIGERVLLLVSGVP